MKDNKEIFSNIYDKGIWPKPFWRKDKFFSGGGSHKGYIIKPYIKFLKNFISANNIGSIADIGCGDFNIMKQVLAAFPNVSYVGVDAAEKVVAYNQSKFGGGNRNFICLDASRETGKFPPADLFICRQVLQHLSNADVTAILEESKRYRYALITDSIYEGRDVRYNLDMETGSSIRLPMKSGIYIDKPPFSLERVAHVLSVYVYEPKRSVKELFCRGRLAIANIRTSLVINW